MTVYTTLCFLSAASILIVYINSKIGKIQPTIAITAFALLLSLLIVISGHNNWFDLKDIATKNLKEIHFNEFLLDGVLGFLLFAGGLGVNLSYLKDQKWEITVLSLGATLISTFIVGCGAWLFFLLIGIPLDFIYCLLFGALISPTDPIAVLAIVKKLEAPKRISSQIEGESLFNDALGLVTFITIFSIAFGTHTPTVSGVIELFLHEIIGGLVFGLLLGLIFHYLICNTDDHSMELLLTLGIPTAGYTLANLLGFSAALSMVVSGIIIGNWTRHVGFSVESEEHLNNFWELVDEFLNNLLFLLIGLSMLTFNFHQEDWIMMGFAIPLVLTARFLSVRLCYAVFNRYRTYNPYSVKILTWGGLRGGLAIAMAMAIPSGYLVLPEKNIDVREIMLVMTYAVVVFSILIQGSTITKLIEKSKEAQETTQEENMEIKQSHEQSIEKD